MPSIEYASEMAQTVQIKVIGVGGAGGNAVNRMVKSGVLGAEFIAMNTDKQILSESVATHKIQIGERTTSGMGTGGDPQKGMKSAEESREMITDILRGASMVFITAGMGGGTGTGAAPIIAEISKEMGILTVGVVTKPFRFEREFRMKIAEEGIKRLVGCVDSLIVIPNEHLKRLRPDRKLPMKEAFELADQVLVEGVRNISELIKVPAYINLDFSDVCTVMSGAGYAHLGVGSATGEDKAREAASQAVSSPLLETTIEGANGLVINVRASEDIDLDDVEAAVDMITETADPSARVIFGILLDENMQDEIAITVIATGFKPKNKGPEPDRGPIGPVPPGPTGADKPEGGKRSAWEPPPWDPEPFLTGRAPIGATAERRARPAAEPGQAEKKDPFAEEYPLAGGMDVDQDHDTVIGMLVDKFQRERGRRKGEND